jgi:integrase
MNYTKLIQNRKPIALPYLVFEDWIIYTHGLHNPDNGKTYTPGTISLLKWKSAFYDRGKRVIDENKKVRKKINSIWLFHINIGQPYIKKDGTANGFDSIWRRFINKALYETKLKERFTEHDLRAKVASDIESEHASKLLGHTKTEITERVYRRKTETVKPFK